MTHVSQSKSFNLLYRVIRFFNYAEVLSQGEGFACNAALTDEKTVILEKDEF